jgi:hypothetical protein
MVMARLLFVGLPIACYDRAWLSARRDLLEF